MTGSRLKQVGWALCLMASLLLGSVSACLCSHHQEKVDTKETSCHGAGQEAVETPEPAVDGDAVDSSCICFVNLQPPFVASKSDSKKIGLHADAAAAEQRLADLGSIAFTPTNAAVFEYDSLAYKHVFESSKPSRAPPRL